MGSFSFPKATGWPDGSFAADYPCSADHTMQKTIFVPAPEDGKKHPLLIALHTWSYHWDLAEYVYAEWCIQQGWAMMHPDFRGPNWTPEACGSDLTIQDIADAVKFAQEQCRIDADRIYLIGCSGGGHETLLASGRLPELWAATSAWVPISDVAAWHRENIISGKCYAEHLVKACGGTPEEKPEEYRHRSPLTWLSRSAGLPLDINTGIHDGHTGSVPVGQSLRAFNLLAKPEDRIPEEDIRFMEEKEAIPDSLKFQEVDPLYGTHKVLFRRISGSVRITVFEGGHEAVYLAGLSWLAMQKKGQPVRWENADSAPLKADGSSVAG